MSARLLTAREVAGRLGVAPDTVLRWTRRGELPAVKLPGGAVRYREDELEAWLAGRSTSLKVTDGNADVATEPQHSLRTRVRSVIDCPETQKGPRG